MIKYLNKHKILHPLQHGFRENDSTDFAITVMYDTLLKILKKKKHTFSIFLDLSKASDTVDHEILLKKLEFYGFRGLILNYLNSYFKQRQQCTKIGSSFSSFLQLQCGILQGSVLGPLLFLIYVNDLTNASNFHTTLFADDTNLHLANSNLVELESLANNELLKVDSWMRSNKLSVNYSKTCFMVISKSINKNQIELKIGKNSLQKVNQVKYLGVILDDKLSWEAHISSLSTKLSRVTGIMYKLRHYAPFNILRTVNFSLFYSHLSYSLLNWGRASTSLIHSIEILQNRCIRAALFCPRRTPLNSIYKKFNTLKLVDLITMSVASFMYRYSNNMLPHSFINYFREISSVHEYNTRSSIHAKFFLHRAKNKFGQKKIQYMGVETWKNIPLQIKQNPYQLFKKQYKSFLFEQY